MKAKETKEVKEEILRVKVTCETLGDILSLIKEKGWEEEEGFRIILGAGYGYLSSHPDINNEKQAGLPKNSEQLIERLVKAEARLGSMRYRAYEIQQANNNWELSAGAVHKENIGLLNIAKRRLKEVDDLHSEIATLKDEKEKLEKIIKEREMQQPDSDNLLKKIKKSLKRK